MIGTLVYLSLTPTLLELGRADLVAAAVASSALTLWPLALSRLAPDFYVRHRDQLLFVQ